MSNNSAAQYTPGPWSDHESAEAINILGDNGQVMLFPLPLWEPDRETCRANARLVVASPDLLAALRQMHGALQLVLAGKDGKQYANLESRSGSFVSMAPLMEQAEQAIAKATKALGEQPQ